MTRALFFFCALAIAVPSTGQTPAPSADQTPSALSADTRALDTLLDRASSTPAGIYSVKGSTVQPAQADLPVVLQSDVLRGPDKSILVPIAVGADVPHAATVRLRVVTAGGPPRIVGDATGTGRPGAVRLVHEFALAPGQYEIQAAVGYRAEGGVTAAFAKNRITVPDVWNSPLAVTPLVIGDAVAVGKRSGAFAFGNATVSPAVRQRFAQESALNVAFRVFNWTPEPGAPTETAKPDLNVEYVFYQKTPKHLAFFNKVKAQHLSGETLGQTFDPASGMVAAGMAIPLVSFPIGEFQLKVRVTDNRTKRTSEQQVQFVVAP